MPFDAIFLSAVAAELRRELPDARVEKVTQPARDTVVLQLRTREGHRKLLLNANPNSPRVQLTELSFENPAAPPMFCMLLRKHLTGGRLTQIVQPSMERAVRFIFSCTDELGVPCRRILTAELLGSASNVVLSDGEDRILDCLRRVSMEASCRPVLPGLYYKPPLRPDRLDPTEVTQAELLTMLREITSPKRFDRWLLDNFSGLSPLIARELSYSITGQTDTDLSVTEDAAREQLAARLAAGFRACLEEDAFSPVLLLREGAPADFSFRPIRQYESYMTLRTLPSFGALLDLFYGTRDLAEKMRQRSQSLRKTMSNLTGRTARKLENQRRELAAAADRERTRQLGDIVTANLYRIVRGQTLLSAEDFYDPEMKTVEIPLSPVLSPQQNAAKLYKDYAKAKTAQRVLTEQIARGETELCYFESILEELDRAETEKDLMDIRSELTDGGYLRAPSGSKKMKLPPAKPMEFLSSDGFLIYVGRNNRQNDLLTTKLADRRDVWLHVQKLHGSHVVIASAGAPLPDRTVTEAMQLAAYYSQARGGTSVPVDYCPVKNVKKPAGAKPGMVVYQQYNTGYVTPSATVGQP